VAYLRLIGDESEVEDVEDLRRDLVDPLEREARATTDALLKGRWEPPLQIHIQGLNLEGEAKERIESELRRTVVEELLEDARAQLRGVQPEPEEGLPLDEDAAISISLGGLRMPRSLGGSGLPAADARRIEARVRQKIEPIVASFMPPGNSAAGPNGDDALGGTVRAHGGTSTCVCAHNTPTDTFRIDTPDGTGTTDLSTLNPVDPPPAPYVIAVFLNNWDALRMTVSRSLVVPSDRMIVSLAIDTDWAKALEAWNFCWGRQAEVFQGGPSTVPNEMTIYDGCGPGHTHTLNFRKPEFLGIWGTKFRPNSFDFWSMLRGRRVDFVWRFD
jgi:hypothetical protein